MGVHGGLPSEWPALPLSQVEVSPDESAGAVLAIATEVASVSLLADLLLKSNPRGVVSLAQSGERNLGTSAATRAVKLTIVAGPEGELGAPSAGSAGISPFAYLLSQLLAPSPPRCPALAADPGAVCVNGAGPGKRASINDVRA